MTETVEYIEGAERNESALKRYVEIAELIKQRADILQDKQIGGENKVEQLLLLDRKIQIQLVALFFDFEEIFIGQAVLSSKLGDAIPSTVIEQINQAATTLGLIKNVDAIRRTYG